MLNITDIEKRLQDFPEPSGIQAIRHDIIRCFSNLEFQEGPHKYYVHNADGTKTEHPSVSSVIEQFEPKADWEKITKNYAEKNGLTYEYVKRMWHENNIIATNNGTSTHLYGENFNYFFRGKTQMLSPVILPQYEDGYLIPYSGKQKAAMRYYEDFYGMYYDDTKALKMYPVMVEAKTYSGYTEKYHFKQNYSGTFDILHGCLGTDNKYRLIIDDFKTNESLENDYNRKMDKRMLPPFDDMIDEPLSHYTIQLSLYSLNLMQLGYTVAARRLIWLRENSTYEKIPVPDVTDRLIEFFSVKED